MIPTLLHLLPMPKQAMAKTVLPLMEVPVDPELAPYLVSSMTGVTWVGKTSTQGFIRTAFRTQSSKPLVDGLVLPSPGAEFLSPNLDTEILKAVFERSCQEKWGSVQPMSQEGYDSAKEYLRSYGITDVELLAHPRTKLGLQAIRATWVPLRMIVLVPKNRLLLGTLHVVSRDHVAAVVHNPSRGMAFCFDDTPVPAYSDRAGVAT